MQKKLCEKCNNEFTLKGGNYERHFRSCDGIYEKLQRGVCKHCCIRFDLDDKPSGWMANHTRWCDLNPNKKAHIKASKECPQLRTKEARIKSLDGIKKAHKNGKYEGSAKNAIETRRKDGTLNHSEETKQLLREKALASKHRRVKVC